MAKATPKKKATTNVSISAPNFGHLELNLVGDAPFMQHAFSAKTTAMMKATQEAGSTAKKGGKRAAKDFDEVFLGAQHRFADGTNGHPASAFRNAMISACRICGFQMTKAKLAVFVEADGDDADSGDPLVKIIGAKPERHIGPARNANGSVDIRCRPMWRKWCMLLRVRYDADMFTHTDILNLVSRVGMQVGIGEGRHDSRKSTGLGFGTFRLADGPADWKKSVKEAMKG